MIKNLIYFSLLTLLISGCATTSDLFDGPAKSLYDGAKRNYAAGLLAFEAKNYSEAMQYFEHIKSQYPYSVFAKLSDLKMADVYFAQKKWLDAGFAYNFFLRFHPNAEEASYAAFKAAESFYKSIPEEFFFLPPSYKKDQSASKDALIAANNFLNNFSSEKYKKPVLEIKNKITNLIAKHDISVAEYYYEREKYQGALWRYEEVLENFPDIENRAEILLRAAHILSSKLNNTNKAVLYLTQVVSKHKNNKPEAQKAEKLLAALKIEEAR